MAHSEQRDALRSRLLHRFSADLNMAAAKRASRPLPMLQLLGTPALVFVADEAAPPSLPLERKDAALLALLASAGASPRAKVAALLWPDADTEGARNNLRQRLFRLRRLAGGDLVDGSAVLHLAEATVHDLAALPARLAADPQAARGDLLGTLDYSDCGELAAWVDLAREQWRSARRAALAEIASRLEHEQPAAALPYAERLVADDPLLEHDHRRLMRLHFLRGDTAAALAAHERSRSALRRELGVAPSEETERLAQLIRSGAAAAAAPKPPPPASPRRPPWFVGRQAEWQCLINSAQAGQSVAIVGPAGIGKTRLLSEFVARHGGPPPVSARLGDAAVPYALLGRLSGSLALRFGLPRAGGPAQELAHITPEFGTVPQHALDPVRLQRGFNALLRRYRARGLSVIGLDDLQHADSESLGFVLSLANAGAEGDAADPADAPGPRRSSWLLSLRGASLPAGWPQFRDGSPKWGLRVLKLPPLDTPAIQALLESLALPGLDAGAWAPQLARRSGGNPAAVMQMLIALPDHEQAPHPATRDAAMLPTSDPQRWGDAVLQGLSADALRLARLLAVAGPDFSVELAADVLRVQPPAVALAWRELQAARLVRDDGFDGGPLADAGRQSLPAAIARLLHADVAAWLAAAGAPAQRVAWHRTQANRPRSSPR